MENNDKGKEQKRPETLVPPHNKDAEQLVLGALILERDTYPTTGELLRPDSFYETQKK